MTVAVRHLQRSQSERVISPVEELNLPYKVELYRAGSSLVIRFAPTRRLAHVWLPEAPASPKGSRRSWRTARSPGRVGRDHVVPTLTSRADGSSPIVPPSAPHFADYQPAAYLATAGFVLDHSAMLRAGHLSLCVLDDRLWKTGAWIAGEQFTAADD